MITSLLPPTTDLTALRHRVRALAEDRPGIYRMLDPTGKVIYVGKAKRLRTRVLSYFRAAYPDDKAARILRAAANVVWEYTPSEFSAHLNELRAIREHRPAYNHQMNRRRNAAFITISPGHAPRLAVTTTTTRPDLRYLGPFGSPGRTTEGLRLLNDLLGLRDCAERLPMIFSEQQDLFSEYRAAGCSRYELGTCSGPCAGLIGSLEYHQRLDLAVSFLMGGNLMPLESVIDRMTETAERDDFEMATRWRTKFEQLEWLIASSARSRAAIQTLTFVYRDPGTLGDDRVYLIRHGLVRATYPDPTTPIEREAFRAVVETEMSKPLPPAGLLDHLTLDEMLLVMSWFRRHPEAWRRTTAIDKWLEG